MKPLTATEQLYISGNYTRLSVTELCRRLHHRDDKAIKRYMNEMAFQPALRTVRNLKLIAL